MRREVLNRTTTPQRLEEIYQLNRSRFHAHGIMVAIALHPRSPAALRESAIPGLFWRDLLKMIASPDVPERTRSQVVPILRKRVERISTGEWYTFAYLCPPRLFEWVLKRSDPRLLARLLENPRMTAEALMKLIHGPGMTPEMAVAIERSDKWFPRKAVRKSLIYCSRGNLTTSLSALRGLTRTELREVAAAGSLHPLIRKTAEAEIRRYESE